MTYDTRPPGTPAVPWTPVTNIEQQERVEAGPDGRNVLGYRISFTTESGTRASIFVPATMYTVENVRALIARKAADIEGVHKLAT